MDRAFLRHTQKFVPLRGAQVTCQRQRRTQAIDAVAFLAGIALHGNLDTLHWNPLMFRVPKHGQCLARAQRGIVEVMGTRPQPLSALLDTEVGGKTISSDVDFMQHRRFLISNDSNRHGLVSLFSSVRGSAILRALIADCATAAVAISAGGVCSASVLRCEAADGGPIETVAALREQPQKAVVQQACERHRHAQTLGRLQREPDVLEPERCSESGRLKAAFGDQATVGLVSGRRKDRGAEHLNVGTSVDARLVDERDGLAQSLDYGGEQEGAAELDEIFRRWLRTYRHGLRTQPVEQQLARSQG